jgi:hypothetical protein
MKRHIIPQHDTAHPHTAHLKLEKTEKFGWKVLLYPPYSLNLAPSDCHLFGPLKITSGASTTKWWGSPANCAYMVAK